VVTAQMMQADPAAEVTTLIRTAGELLQNARQQLHESIQSEAMFLLTGTHETFNGLERITTQLRTLTFIRTHFSLELISKWKKYAELNKQTYEIYHPIIIDPDAERSCLLTLTYFGTGASEMLMHVDVPRGTPINSPKTKDIPQVVGVMLDRCKAQATFIEQAITKRVHQGRGTAEERQAEIRELLERDEQHIALSSVVSLIEGALQRNGGPQGYWAERNRTGTRNPGLSAKGDQFNPSSTESDIHLSDPTTSNSKTDYITVEYDRRNPDNAPEGSKTKVHVVMKYAHPQSVKMGAQYDQMTEATIRFCNGLQRGMQGEFEVTVQAGQDRFVLNLAEYGGYGSTWVDGFTMKAQNAPDMDRLFRSAFDFTSPYVKFEHNETKHTLMKSRGKINEVTAMVEAVRMGYRNGVIDEDFTKQVTDFLKRDDEEHDSEYKDRILSKARAYYTSENPNVHLGPCGDRAMFIINVQGRIFGARTYTKNMHRQPLIVPRGLMQGAAPGPVDETNFGGPNRDRQHSQPQHPPRRNQRGPGAYMPQPPGDLADAFATILERLGKFEELYLRDSVRNEQEKAEGKTGAVAKSDFQRLEEMVAKALHKEEELQAQRRAEELDPNQTIVMVPDVDPELMLWGYTVEPRTYATVPFSITMSGVPLMTVVINQVPDGSGAPMRRRTVSLSEQPVDLTFKLKSKYATTNGVLLYTAIHDGTVYAALYAMPMPLPGFLIPQWKWILSINGVGSFQKSKDARVLLADPQDAGDGQPERVQWVPTGSDNAYSQAVEDDVIYPVFLAKEDAPVPRSEKAKDNIVALYTRVDVNRGMSDILTQKQMDLKPNPCTVYGPFNHMYQLRVYEEFSQRPMHSDYFGRAPVTVQMKLKKEDVVKDEAGNSLRTSLHSEQNYVFRCVDSKELVYEYTEGSTRLLLKRYCNYENKSVTWGLSIVTDNEDERFVAFMYTSRKRKFPKYDTVQAYALSQAILDESDAQWSFLAQLNGAPKEPDMFYTASFSVDTENITTVRRIPEAMALSDDIRSNKCKLNSTVDPITAAQWKELITQDRLFMYDLNNTYAGKAKEQVVVDNGDQHPRARGVRQPKFRIVKVDVDFKAHHHFKVWDTETMEAIKARMGTMQLQGDRRPVMPGEFNAPMHISLSHEYANGRGAGPGVNRQDFEFLMIDAQGPVYVSLTGKYMFAPATQKSDTGGYAYFWALYRWNAKEARYIMIARKVTESRTLLHDPWVRKEGRDRREQLALSQGQWRALGRFQDDNMFQGQALVDPQNVKMNMYVYVDFRKMDATGRVKNPSNPYEIFIRFPDYLKPIKSRSVDQTGRVTAVTTWEGAEQLIVPSYVTIRTPWYHNLKELRASYKSHIATMWKQEQYGSRMEDVLHQAIEQDDEQTIKQLEDDGVSQAEINKVIDKANLAKQLREEIAHVRQVMDDPDSQMNLDAVNMPTITKMEIAKKAFVDTYSWVKYAQNREKMHELNSVNTVISMEIPVVHPDDPNKLMNQKIYLGLVNPYTMEYRCHKYGLSLRPVKCGSFYAWRMYQYLLGDLSPEQVAQAPAEPVAQQDSGQATDDWDVAQGRTFEEQAAQAAAQNLAPPPAAGPAAGGGRGNSGTSKTKQTRSGGAEDQISQYEDRYDNVRAAFEPKACTTTLTAGGDDRAGRAAAESPEDDTRPNEFLFATKVVRPGNLMEAAYIFGKTVDPKTRRTQYQIQKDGLDEREMPFASDFIWRLNGTDCLLSQAELARRILAKETMPYVSYYYLAAKNEGDPRDLGDLLDRVERKNVDLKNFSQRDLNSLPQNIMHDSKKETSEYIAKTTNLVAYERNFLMYRPSLMHEMPGEFILNMGTYDVPLVIDLSVTTTLSYLSRKTWTAMPWYQEGLRFLMRYHDGGWHLSVGKYQDNTGPDTSTGNFKTMYDLFFTYDPIFNQSHIKSQWRSHQNGILTFNKDHFPFLNKTQISFITRERSEDAPVFMPSGGYSAYSDRSETHLQGVAEFTTQWDYLGFFHKINDINSQFVPKGRLAYIESKFIQPAREFSTLALDSEMHHEEDHAYRDEHDVHDSRDIEELLDDFLEARQLEQERLAAAQDAQADSERRLPLQPRKLAKVQASPSLAFLSKATTSKLLDSLSKAGEASPAAAAPLQTFAQWAPPRRSW